jgi:hypothetical protein
MGAGGVAVQDLQDEQVDGGQWAEDPLAPAVAAIAAELLQGLGLQEGGEVVPDPPQGISE